MTPDHLADRTLPAALRAVRAARRRVLALARKHPGADPWALVDRIRAELAKVEPQLARILTSATLAGWVLAARRPAKSAMPKAVASDEGADYPASGLHGKPDFSGGPVFPDSLRFAPPGADEWGRPVEFPLVRAAVRDLFQRQVVTQREYDDLGAQAKAAAFTVARVATADAVEAVRDAVAETVAQGKTLREFREDVEGALDGSGLADYQVEAVFRTQVGQAQAAGLRAAYDHPAVAAELPYLWYDYTHDARARPDHIYLGTHGLDGTGVYRCDDPVIRRFMPPWSWNCFLPGSEVQGRFLIGLRMGYRGKAVEVVTDDGQRLRVTANHPVLTPKGFVPAQSLREGDHVLRHRGGVVDRLHPPRGQESIAAVTIPDQPGFTPPREHKHDRPALAEDVFRALADRSDVVRVPVRADDLHGDAIGGDGYVEVVAAERELLLDLEAVGNQRGRQFGFAGVDGNLPLLAGARSPDQRILAVGGTPTGRPGGGHLLLDSLGVGLQPRPLHPLRVGLAAEIDACRLQCPGYGESAESEFARQLCDRYPGLVAVDRVVQVRDFDWLGHVYDFQTEGGWLVSDTILTSNCRCVVIPLTLEDAAAKGVREARQWLATGREPSPPARVAEPPFGPPPGWPDSSGIRAVIG